MTMKDAVSEIKRRWRELYPHDGHNRHGDGIVCPLCGSGSGPHGTGITENPEKPGRLKCRKCGFNGDVLSLMQQELGISFAESVRYAAALLGIALDEKKSALAVHDINAVHVADAVSKDTNRHEGNCMAKYKEWQNALQKPDSPGAAYLERRGISIATAMQMGVGYAPEWQSPKAVASGKRVPPSPRIIFPKTEDAYATRDIRLDSAMSENSRRYKKQNQGCGGIFYVAALGEGMPDPVVVCEGPMDALSAAEAGCNALAVCGTSGRTALVEILKEHRSSHTFLLAMDSDEAGEKAAIALKGDLDELGIRNAVCPKDVYLGKKDLNEALCTNRKAYVGALEAAVDSLRQQVEEERQTANTAYDNSFSAISYLDSFDTRTSQYSDIPTGFARFDNLLGGGLHPGLYIIGAVSSLGKTTFCLQVMDQIMANGRDVMIFSLETGRDELMAKSLSRIAYTLDHKTEDGLPLHPLTTRGILNGQRRMLYTKMQKTAYLCAKQQYRDTIAKRCFLIESNGEIGATEIQQIVNTHIKATGRRPVVLVDYLQILAPAENSRTDKWNTDRAVFLLKRLSRDAQIPIVGISSFSRENYTMPVSQASFKESGVIGHSSDVLIGLQYDGMDLRHGESESERLERVRDLKTFNQAQAAEGRAVGIQLKVLKNRNGELGDTKFWFNPRYNVYIEMQ